MKFLKSEFNDIFVKNEKKEIKFFKPYINKILLNKYKSDIKFLNFHSMVHLIMIFFFIKKILNLW